MVKIMKQEHKVNNILLQCSNVLASFIFIELSYFSSSDNFIPFPLLMKSSKGILQFDASLSSQPSIPIGSIQSIVFCLYVKVMLRHTSNELKNLDYDKISIQKVRSLSIVFNGDVLFKLSALLPNA